MVNARFCCAAAAEAMKMAMRSAARFMARMLSSYDSALHAVARAVLRRMERHLRDAATLDAGHWKNSPAVDAADQSLVAGHSLRDIAWTVHLAHSGRCPHARYRLRFCGAPVDGPHQ